jgi:hypothetical protein
MPMAREGLCIRYAVSACPVSPCKVPDILGEGILGKVYAYVAASVDARPLYCLRGTVIYLVFASASQLAIITKENRHVVPPTSKNNISSYPKADKHTTSGFPSTTLGARLCSHFRSESNSYRDRLCSWNVRSIYSMDILEMSD